MANRHFPASIPVVELKELWDLKDQLTSRWPDAIDLGSWCIGCLNAMLGPTGTVALVHNLDDATALGHWQSLTSNKGVGAGIPPWLSPFILWLIEFLAKKGA